LSHLKRAFAVVAMAATLGACASIGTVQKVATATVPAEVVIPAANSFNILKGAATNYGRYCIQQRMEPVICSAPTRRAVIKAVRVGTGARDRMVATLENGTPAAASVFNLMVGAMDDLKNSPANTTQFTGIPTQ
jgi:hypothetical protein